MRGFLEPLLLAFLASASPLLAVEGQWRVLGPDGGPVTDLAFQPGSSAVLYAALPGAVYKSRDAGATWEPTGPGLDARSQTLGVAVDPVRPETVYVAQGGGVFRSVNGGQSWRYTGLATAFQVAAHPRSSGTVFAATYLGLYRTTNGGATWVHLAQGLPRSYSASLIAFDPAVERRLYAFILGDFNAATGKLYRSTDSGTTWQPLRSNPQGGQRIYALAVDPRTRGTLYAGTDKAVYKSVDDGISWRPTALTQAGFVWTLKLHPRLGTLYAGTNSGLFRSPDGGASWRPLFRGLEGNIAVALTFSPASAQTLYAGIGTLFERGGVFRSGNGGLTWAFSGRGISALTIESIAVDRQAPDTLWVTANTLPFKSVDRGRTWARVRPGPDGGDGRATRVAVDPADGATVYLLLADGTLRRTRDGGQSWESAGNPGNSAGNGTLAIDPRHPETLYAAGLGVAKSTDAGAHWALLPGDPADLVFFDLALAPSSPATLYGTGGGGAGGPRVVRSRDGGATWTRAQQGLPSNLFNLAVDPQVSTTVYGGLDGNVYKTSDGGESWSLLSDAFRDRTAEPLAISPLTSGLLYAGVWFDDVYELQDGGGDWQPLGTSPRGEVYVTIVPDPTDPCRIYAGTGSHGLLAFTRTGTAGCE